MADITLRQDGQLPIATRVRYQDMGDGTHALVTSVVETGHPNGWKTNNNYGAAQTDAELRAAPGAGLHLYLTAVILSTEGAQNIRIVSDTAGGPSTLELGPYYFAANGGMVAMIFEPAIQIPANTNVGVTSSGAVNHTVTLIGYVAP